MVTVSVFSTEIDPVCHAACGSLRADPVVMFHPVSAASTGDSEVIATASAESPVLAADAGWNITTGSSLNEPQAAWHTGSISVEKTLTVTIAAAAPAE